MTTYKVRFSIDGEIDIEADSWEEAQDMTRAISKAQWAEVGDLVVDKPMTAAEYHAAIRAVREGPAAEPVEGHLDALT